MCIRVFCLVLILFPLVGTTEIPQRPIIRIEMNEVGMHRELFYTVQFDYPLAGKECEYMLVQLLPAAVYVSTDQLNDLKRLGKLNAKHSNFVDIEMATEHALPFTVLLPGTPKITDSIVLPIHFRYHTPNAERTFVSVNINTPSMYINCPDSENELAAVSETPYCLSANSDAFDRYDSTKFCNAEHCNWKLVNVDFQLKTPLRALIPVGNATSYILVLYATIILSWLVSLWTVFRTQSVPKRINHKLNEQRLLQQKCHISI